MAHGHQSKDKVVYVGDSRIVKRNHPNIPRDYSAYPGKSEAFIPNFLLKEWMVGAVVLVGFLALVIAEHPPLGYPADPTNTSFIPMPDWYFLFLYQFLKYDYVSGDYVVWGTIVFPGLLFGGLFLAPFLDKGKERRFYRRPIASSLMGLSLIACIYLTWVSWDHYTHEMESKGMLPEHIQRELDMEAGKEMPKPGAEKEEIAIVEQDSEGYSIYQKSSCVACHATDLTGTDGFAPQLRGVGDIHTKEEIIQIMKEGTESGKMGPQWEDNINNKGLTEEELDKLAEWLSAQKKAS
ncbi:c-type cytochrome [Marinicrinis lubricantis]|uniref:C-type cytochrome n=1 Tax=Marinicrinis lubricantis TaxID=2086470 RepID=A0ABW1IM33_9BACL